MSPWGKPLRTPTLAVVSAAVLIVLAGCGQPANSAGAGAPAAVTTTAPADPVERINTAAAKINEASFKFSIESDGVKATGVRHQPSDSTQLTMTGSADGNEFSIELIQIRTDMWMKLDFGIDPGDDPAMQGLADALGGWTHVSKDEAESNVGSLAKAGAAAMGTDLIKGAADLKETAPGTFTGTIDLSSRLDLDIADKETIAALGDKAKAVPITVILDSEERLSTLVLDIPAAGKAKAQQAKIKFFDFDKVEQPKAPPADQVKEK